MAEEKSTYLLLCLHGDEELSAAFQFLPTDADIDGIWVHTTLTMGNFRSEFEWFLATKSQQELASLATDLSRAKGASEFVIRDTDCSFAATFTPSSSIGRFDVAVEYRCCWGRSDAADTAIILDLKHASAPLSEVQRLLQNLSQFS
jgi:hypothetical protein